MRRPLALALLFGALLIAGFVALHVRRPVRDVARAEELIADGDQAFSQRRWQDATASYGQAIDLDVLAARGYVGRGKALLALGELGAAARNFRGARMLDRDNDEAYLGRSAVRSQEGDIEGAVRLLQRALRISPQKPEPYLNLANLRSLLGDREGMAAALTTAADLYTKQGNRAAGRQVQALLPDERPPSSAPVQGRPLLVDDLLGAERVLVSAYVEELDPAQLLDSAYAGAVALLERRGISAGSAQRPEFGPSQPRNDLAVRSAFSRLAVLSAGRVSMSDIVSSAISAMAASLDDNHTVFAPFRSLETLPATDYRGLGYVSAPYGAGDQALVRAVAPGSAAARAGLRPGDVVTALEQIGSSGSVRVRVEREGSRSFEALLSSSTDPAPALQGELLDDGIAYVRLDYFPAPTVLDEDGETLPRLLDGLLARLRHAGARAWVLDLRSNPGGVLSTAAVIAGRFGYEGRLIKQLRRDEGVTYASAVGKSAVGGRPVVVLIDGQSISSAEILAEGLQRQGLAYVVGQQSAGRVNGAVAIGLGGGLLEVTTARILSGPALRQLDGVGVTPDESVDLDRRLLAEGRDSQLERAVDYLKQRLAKGR